MGWCTTRGEGRLACEHRDGRKAALCAGWVARLYPGGEWGRIDDAARAGVSRGEAAALGRAASRDLRAPVYFVPGGDDDLCEALYVLCVGRHPGAVAALCGGTAPAGEVREAYLGVLLSSVVRAACVQEVRVCADLRGDEWVLEERPRDGVYDPVLLPRVRRLVALLEAHGLEHLDMGVLEGAPEGVGADAYVARFGEAPTYFNWLFRPAPVTTARTVVLPAT